MLKNLLSLNYWFSLQPPDMRPLFLRLSLGFFLIILGGGVVLRLLASFWRRNPPLSRFLKRLSKPFFFLSLLGYLFLFFKRESIYFLGARFWFLFLGLGFLVWVLVLIVKFLKTYPKEQQAIEKERQFKKYFQR
jgi:hypothetical protein